MKIKYLISILALAMFMACQQEAPKVDLVEEDSVEVEAIEDTITTRNVDDSNIKPNVESLSHKNNVVSKSINSANPTLPQENTKQSVAQSNTKSLSTADDIDGELNNEVNRKMNPDNYNGISELNDESKLVLIPIMTAQEKSKYYVQFVEKAIKLSKAELIKLSPNFEKIYVINHLGLYKYSVGQFNTEVEALSYKAEAMKKYNLKRAEVATYSEAW